MAVSYNSHSTKNTFDENAVQVISPNKTLFINKCTFQNAERVEIAKDLQSIADVFSYYRPEATILLETNTGTVKKETFQFNSLVDFKKRELIKKSGLLYSLNDQKEYFFKIERHLYTNQRLIELITNETAKADFSEMLQGLRGLFSGQESGDLNKNTALFEVLENVIPETSFLKSDSLSREKILKSINKNKSKEQLAFKLQTWELVLQSGDTIADILNFINESTVSIEECYQKNLNKIISEIRALESAYRATALFFENAKTIENNIWFLNASIEQLTDTDNSVFIDAVSKALNASYDRLDLSDNYSLLVVPGYLKSNSILEKWAKIAYNNKVLLITDFMHLDTAEDVVELFEESNLSGPEAYKSNIIMTCNWLVGRGKYAETSEQDDLYVSSAAALAGTIYSTLISQASAGKAFGVLQGVEGVRFKLHKSDLSMLEKLGLIPLRYENGTYVAYSSKTLFNGPNLGKQTYCVVRVFDYLTKVLMDFFNRRTFENFNAKVRKELMAQVVDFLDQNVGPNKLIDSFVIKKFEQDANDKNRIHLDLRIEPYFPSKSFALKMDFEATNEDKKWDTSYELA